MPKKPKKVKAAKQGVLVEWISPIYLTSKGCFYYTKEGDKVWCCGPKKGKVEKKKDLENG
jgi:hypothetical protein